MRSRWSLALGLALVAGLAPTSALAAGPGDAPTPGSPMALGTGAENTPGVIDSAIGLFDGSRVDVILRGDESLWVGNPDWAPSGEELVYETRVLGDGRLPDNQRIEVMSADGTGRRPITDPATGDESDPQSVVELDTSPHWSPDGNWIVFERLTCVVPCSTPTRASIMKVRPDGTGLVEVIGVDGGDQDYVEPRWSPDSQRIAFVHVAAPGNDIYTVDADGTGLENITADLAGVDVAGGWAPDWSPDGTQLVFWARDAAFEDQIWTIDADGANPRLLVDEAYMPRSSRDGHVYFYNYNIYAGGPSIERIPWAGGTREVVVGDTDLVAMGSLHPGFAGRFGDDDGSIFQADIEAIAASGVTNGCNPPINNLFCPKDEVTREQMAAFIVRALGLTDADHPGFSDVPAGSTFATDIRKLAKAGITRGCNPPANDRFCPRDQVSRQQMAAFLVRALGLTDADHPGFVDVTPGSTFEDDIKKLARAGITRGCNPPTNDRFCPGDNVTREQMAALMNRAGWGG